MDSIGLSSLEQPDSPTTSWLSRGARLAVSFGVAVLVGCSGGSYAPVSDRSLTDEGPRTAVRKSTRPAVNPRTKHYRVRKGDTLYSIAFRYGKDFSALARANGIDADYRIYPGQLLRLVEAPPAVKRPSPVAPATRATRPTAVASSSTAPAPAASVPRSTAVTRQSSSTSSNSGNSAEDTSPLVWGWPVQGRVLQGFSAKGKVNKGINIAARKGESVRAAARGSVVYAGSGLLGYGNLIIINHNQQYLSAYAHNSKIFVKEHDRVKKGEKIAEAGNSGTTRSMLHFEIRKDGKPVNPLRYLPQR